MAEKSKPEQGCVGFDVVYSREIDAINDRREALKRDKIKLARARILGLDGKPIYQKSIDAGLVGLSLSGGGIRSASFCLGTMQALEVDHVLEKIDLLSTVSGGGYIGTSYTASVTRGTGVFPFPSTLRDEEPKPLKHIRDHSNFLIPGGLIDVLYSAVVYLRGLVANVAMVLPWLFLFAVLSILIDPVPGLHPSNSSFLKAVLWLPRLIWPQLVSFHFVVTAVLFVYVTAAFLIAALLAQVWWRATKKSESDSLLTRFLALAVLGVFGVAFCELQLYVIDAIFQQHEGSFWSWLKSGVQLVIAVIAALGAVLGFFWRTLEYWVRNANKDSRLRKRLLAIGAKLGILVASLVVPFVLWMAYMQLTVWGIQFSLMWPYIAVAIVLLLLESLLFDPNTNSLHRLYRDRSSKAFLFDLSALKTLFDDIAAHGLMVALRRAFLSGKAVSGDLPPLDDIKLTGLSSTRAPFHIINTALNIQNSKFVNRRGRNADFFMFGKNHIGSEATGYAKTADMEAEDPDLDVATAMATSGAALSANMGSSTIRTMTPTLALLNIRLGRWLRNPDWRSMRLRLAWWLVEHLNLYFFLEMFGLLREDSWLVYLTDGGHIENLGIYELLKRDCRLIIAIDAETDPEMNFPSFVKLQRYARIDLGVIIDLPWRRLSAIGLETGNNIATTGGPAAAETRKGPHCVVGTIQYPNSKKPGYIVYLKPSLSGDENDYIADYKRRNETFPHETTGDQFFTEEQFEVYRALGFHAMRSFLKGSEEMPTFADRHDDPGPTPPMYARPLSPDGRKAIDEIRTILGLKPLSPAPKPKR